MFMPNDVYAWDEKRIRILWSNRHTIFWIDIDDDCSGLIQQDTFLREY